MAGEFMQAAASKEAADSAEKAAKENREMTIDEMRYQRGIQEPFIKAGTKTMNDLSGLLSPGGGLRGKFQFNPGEDPGAVYRARAAQDALMAQGAASGNYFSGGLGSALQDQAQKMASQEYGDAYNRWTTEQNNLYQRLFGVSQLASGQATASGAMGQQAIQQAAGWNMAGAQANGAGLMGIAAAAKAGEENAWNKGSQVYGMVRGGMGGK